MYQKSKKIKLKCDYIICVIVRLNVPTTVLGANRKLKYEVNTAAKKIINLSYSVTIHFIFLFETARERVK